MHEGGKDQRYRRIAWSLWAFEIALALVAVSLALNGRSAPYEGWGFRGFPSLAALAFASMGLLILARQPQHAIGWVFLGIGGVSSLQAVLFEYMIYGLILVPGSLPGALLVAWILNAFWVLMIILCFLLVLLFPDGRLPSARWRFISWFIPAGLVVTAGLGNLSPGPLDSSIAGLQNPYALETLSGTYATLVDLLLVGFGLVGYALAALNLFRSFRRSTGRERQQFKWFLFAALLLVLTLPTAASPYLLVQALFIAAMFFLPLAVVIAILRYRLWDIDLIIRRTLVYSLLTGILVAVYLGSVILLQSFFLSLTGERSQAAIALSTLGTAVLFTPLRRRLQNWIDHRFYRRRYDAEHTLQSFAHLLREETDLNRLSDHPVSVVGETVQPEIVSLWLLRREGNQEV